MTKLLEKAFKEASKLPDEEQDTFARWLLEELESERKWEQAFADSEDVLEELGKEALEAHRQGKTKQLDLSNRIG